MGTRSLEFTISTEVYCVAKLPAETRASDKYLSVVRDEELTVVAAEPFDFPTAFIERGWKAVKIVGPLDFSEVGIMAEISGLLAGAGISVFGISTFSTDYFLVKLDRLAEAIRTLESAGHRLG